MSYNAYITRAEDWTTNQADFITPDEWIAAVRADPELQIVLETGPRTAEWLPDPSIVDGSYFEWRDGNVVAQNPSKKTIIKLEQLAAKLGARVQLDSGEFLKDGEVERE
jgi:hypothetical protein